MSVPSLAGLCRKTIFANIDELSYVSTLPYEKCRGILKHVKTARQLAIIEEYSPQIIGEDSELWEAFIKRDFPVPMKRKNYEPENPRSWRKVYERYAKEESEAEAHALAQLGATYAGLNKIRQQKKSNIADPRLLPRIGRIGGMTRSRGKGFGSGAATLTFGGGARTKNVVQKAKKEAMEVAARKKLSTPALNPRTNLVKVQQAPESMRNEYRIKRQPAFLPPTKTGTKRPRDDTDERAEREARLLAAKKPKVQPKVLRDDELEDLSAATRKATGLNSAAAAATADSGASSNSKRPMGLFSRSQNPSRQQQRVIVKPASQPVSRASPEKTTSAPKARPKLAETHPRSSRPTDPSPNTRVSSPDYENFRASKTRPRRSSRSPSVASSLFGSPEPEPTPRRRMPSFQSSDDRSPSPIAGASTTPARHPTKRSGTSEVAKVQASEAKAGSPSKRRNDDSDFAGTSSAAATLGTGEGSAAQMPRKKKRVDIFMRPKKVNR